jgi:hypothetical protein
VSEKLPIGGPIEVFQLDEEYLKFEAATRDQTLSLTISPAFMWRLSVKKGLTWRVPFPKLRGMLEIKFRWSCTGATSSAG